MFGSRELQSLSVNPLGLIADLVVSESSLQTSSPVADLITEKYVIPQVEEHMASYVHLLPKEDIVKVAKMLCEKRNYEIYDRLLHKAKFVADEQYSYADKMEVIKSVQQSSNNEFIKDKANKVKVFLIRNNLCED